MNLDRVFENNENWIQEKLSVDPNYFKNMGKGQNPELLFIGCSDSRVHRNIANMVYGTDLNTIESEEERYDKLVDLNV